MADRGKMVIAQIRHWRKLVQKIVNWLFEPGSERRVCKIYENTPNYEKFIKNILKIKN
jgi:hypothetical protein